MFNFGIPTVKYDLIIDMYSLSHCGGCCGKIKGTFPVGEWTQIIPPKKHTKCRNITIKPVDKENFIAMIAAEGDDKHDYIATCKWHHSKGENYCEVVDRKFREEEPTELPNTNIIDKIQKFDYTIKLEF
jgi:hypothetical protein